MALRSSIQAYFQIRPVGWRDASRLYLAYLVSLLAKILAPARFGAVGLLIPGRGKLTIAVGGVFAHVRPGTNDLDLLAPSYEPQTAAWIRVKTGDFVIDVGAHIGRYTLFAAKRAARVVAIEPDPSNFSLLQANIQLNNLKNVTALNWALSSSRGRRRLYLADRENTGTSSLEAKWVSAPLNRGPKNSVEVECVTLDHLVESLGLETIDWLKIDVEGHEVAVLEGAPHALRCARHLILEVAEGNEDACRNLVRQAGLQLVAIEWGAPTSNWFLVRS